MTIDLGLQILGFSNPHPLWAPYQKQLPCIADMVKICVKSIPEHPRIRTKYETTIISRVKS